MSGNQDRDDMPTQLARATWLLGLISKRMDIRPDGSAHVDLPAGMVSGVREFLADQAASA